MKATLLITHVLDRTTRSAPGIGSAANISFTGEVHDDETGLDTYKFRSYNPQLGRWMSPDPSSLHFPNLASRANTKAAEISAASASIPDNTYSLSSFSLCFHFSRSPSVVEPEFELELLPEPPLPLLPLPLLADSL